MFVCNYCQFQYPLFLQDLFRDLVDPWALYCLLILFILDAEESLSCFAEVSLNIIHELSLFTLVWIRVIQWEHPVFIQSILAFGGGKYFGLSLMIFGEFIGGICDLCFDKGFAFLVCL